MRCQTPECAGEHEARMVTHQVVYQERTLLLHNVPADVCPECGDILLAHETIFHIGNLLGRKARSKIALVYEV